jgi:NAD(P)-dependent dehydrogenase (short-subunit alcohol dehydrogenase family)
VNALARSVDLALARAVDLLLEGSFVGSNASVGIRVRRSLEHWGLPERLDGKVVLVTGGTSGIGLAAATAMARLGASVRMLGRDPAKAERARATVRSVSGNPDVEVDTADLADWAAVVAFAERFTAANPRLDVLVNNGGSLDPTYQRAPDGTEATLASHLVGAFVLTRALLASLEAAGPGRVITVTSSGMYLQRFELANLEMPEATFRFATAYARAKRAQVVLTAEWARTTDRALVTFHANHPGWVDTVGLQVGLPAFTRLTRPLLRRPEEGADTMVWLAGAPAGLIGSGRLWHDRRPRSANRFPGKADIDSGAALVSWLESRSAGVPT